MSNPYSNNSTIKSLWDWWFYSPSNLTLAERRTDTVLTWNLPFPWLFHFFYIFLFAYWGIRPLAFFNIFSVLIWTTVIILRRQPQQYWRNLGYPIIAGEMIVHAALVIHYLGWGFGGQYYLFALIAIGFIYPWPRLIAALLTILNAILFILFYYYAESHLPLFFVPPVQLAIMNIINIATTCAMFAAIMLYFITLFDRAEAALGIEHAKSEALLNNVLPKSIATRLKQDNVTIAEGFSGASILFADIAGFTLFSQQITPQELVNILDEIFSRFDELVEEYGLEKIKTIGDEYMVAAGIPIPREDHAEALAHFAFAMRDALVNYNATAGTNLQMRIGINSGPVVAGVIGKSRFIYDLWGDSVNTASRMESHGQVGEIQITDATRQLLNGKFSFIDRGMVEVKGKGLMQTYFLAESKA